jgi:uroporphyrin-3 C-methyltransferase
VNSEFPENDSELSESSQAESPESKVPDTNRPKADEPVPVVKQSRPGRGGFLFSLLAFLLALAAVAGTGWMWWQERAEQGLAEGRIKDEVSRLEGSDRDLASKLSQVRNEVGALSESTVGAELEALQRQIETDRSKMAEVDQALAEQRALARSLQAATDAMQGRLIAAEAAVTGMSARELDAGGELDLAEVDYLLRLANERLKLFSDPGAADRALEVADMHLAAIDNPMYLGVRQEIATARRELAAVEMPDYLEIANSLDSVQQSIPALPFKGDGADASAVSEVEGEGWWLKVKRAFSNLVTVRRSTDRENERISLQDKDFIRQRVWLQLEIAHLSLMRRDQAAFTSSLERARESLATWFDMADSRSLPPGRELERLLELEIQVDVPDITAPWSTLRLLRGTRPGAMPAPAAEDIQGESNPETKENAG